MYSVNDFDNYAEEYDHWFDKHPVWFASEVKALDMVAPHCHFALEIGVGTGRFSSECGIEWGIDPSENMARIAEQRGTNVLLASAEQIPFLSETFGYVLMVTGDCFLSDISKAFSEVYRVLKPMGVFVIGMIDRDSHLGQKYEAAKASDRFYKHARFHTPDELTYELKQAGFTDFEYWQTLITASETEVEVPRKGYGKGGFVVIKAAAKK